MSEMKTVAGSNTPNEGNIAVQIEKIKQVLKKYTMDAMLLHIEEQIKGKDTETIKTIVKGFVSDSDIRAFKLGYESALGAICARTGLNLEWVMYKEDLKDIYKETLHLIEIVGL